MLEVLFEVLRGPFVDFGWGELVVVGFEGGG